MELNTVHDSFERATKRQKLLSSKSQDFINQVTFEIEQSLATITPDNDAAVSVRTVLTELKAKLQGVVSLVNLEELQRELNINLSKHQKTLEKMLHPDLSKACRKVDFDSHILNQIVISHFYHKGLFDIVDCLIQEANEPEAVSLRAQFQELHEIVKAMSSRNPEPALNWATANRERLKKSGSDIELKIHRLHFIQILQNRSRSEALKYAKTHLAPFALHHMRDVQKLMGSLLWAGRVDKSPYADLANPVHWDKLADEIVEMFLDFSGQPLRDPLSVAVGAGGQGLPTLLKLANVMAGKKQELQELQMLPVPVELGKEFQFHSVFVCPVSREQGSKENPPMMLPCGHMLCKESINKMSKHARSFKCPYCPETALPDQCKQICF
ncbi:hypothetical protein OROMI_033259 [Orobanche minor]